ncbi:uncharacterized protein LOC124253256 [Haliotis rubra]|uniref:uncharacterized protein LOC124253256 n=1 Tax=Haliotis rubra TaxID=36100 RepID=UPI001EE56D3F|nr:uncharacterized protein LOC124253256 [Haliotis rubra]
MDCQLNTRCVERRGGGAVCVEGPTVSSTLESSCFTDSDCSAVRKFVCFTKTCKCIPGYSFNPANNSCVRRCNTYGRGFTTYRGLAMVDNNDRIKLTKNVKKCSEMCFREKRFLVSPSRNLSGIHRATFQNPGI